MIFVILHLQRLNATSFTMLTKIHIENFKSLKNVTLELQPVNLLIGPNNSGKTNFLKALEFIKNQELGANMGFADYTFKHENVDVLFLVVSGENSLQIKIQKKAPDTYPKHTRSLNDFDTSQKLSEEISTNTDINLFLRAITQINLYRPNPLKFTDAEAIVSNNYINEDASNLVPFLETLRDEYREHFAEIEEDLRKCIPEFHDIRFKTVASGSDKRTFKKWGLYSDISKMIYWADELSEGVLYFLALLCIIHQPNPPKILLLEEPERGIHPRRIKEVVDFIFNLAQSKDIQVILTSHHPYILNEFEDIPEAVFVFDKDEEGATQIRNLQKDIIAPSDAKNDVLGLPRIKFTQDLAEHWFSGFLGGVPA